MPMNNRILRPLARPLLLDAVPGAAAAYSLRQLSNAYTGPVVTVRRSSDDAEEDFKASEIDDGTLAAFCGAGDGLVKTWHDQSGNGNDASQGTAAAQPKIVDSGSLVTEGGKAAIELDGTDDYLEADIAGFRSIQNLTSAAVFSSPVAAQADVSTAFLWGFGVGFPTLQALSLASATSSLTGEYLTIGFDSGGVGRRLGSTSYRRAANEQALLFSTHLQSGTAMFSDGASLNLDLSLGMTTATPAAPSNTGHTTDDLVFLGAFKLGSGAIVAHVQEKFQEIIFYPSDQSANRQRIEGDLAWYY